MQIQTSRKFAAGFAAAVIASVMPGSSVRAADAAPGTLPGWVTELSVSAKETWDNNVYGSDEVLQPGYPDLVKKSSWVTTVGARFFFSVSALAGEAKDKLILGYAPTYNRFSSYSDETNTQHRFSVQSKGKADVWSWNLDNTTTVIAGSRDSLRYTGSTAYGAGLPRERRSQIQDSGKFSLKYDLGETFVRAAAGLTYYDLLIHHHVTTGEYAGYQNFVDRYDVNAGLDLGWNVKKDTALTVGWRTGHQYQQSFNWVPSLMFNSINNYNRLLLGIEGKPLAWLSINLVAGPDFRKFTAPESQMGVSHNNQTALYLETNATVTLGADDSLTLTGKQWRWVSSTGRVIYDDKSWLLAWKHKLNAAFSFQLSTQFQQAQYVNYPAAISTTGRNDTLFNQVAQVQWNVTKALSLTAEVLYQKAENRVDAGAISGREYKRTTFGLGAKYAF